MFFVDDPLFFWGIFPLFTLFWYQYGILHGQRRSLHGHRSPALWPSRQADGRKEGPLLLSHCSGCAASWCRCCNVPATVPSSLTSNRGAVTHEDLPAMMCWLQKIIEGAGAQDGRIACHILTGNRCQPFFSMMLTIRNRSGNTLV